MIKVPVQEATQLPQRLTALSNRIEVQWSWEVPLELVARPLQNKRTRSQNNLYWVWLTVLSEAFRGPTKEEMHDLMRHKFLGTEEALVLGERVTRLPSTTLLTPSEMAEYMQKIEAWAADMGVLLPIPEDNVYTKYREAM